MAVGLAAGIFAGGLGVGGGIILVPLFIWVGLDRHRAHATSLASIILIGVVGALSFGYSGEVRLDVGLAIGLGGIVGSVLGANAMNRMSARSLTIVFGLVLLVAGLRMVSGGEPLPGAGELSTAALVAISIGIGLASGFFAGIAGVGGGVVIVPAAVFFIGLSQYEAQGTSLLAIVLTAVAATWTNFRNGRVVPKDGLLAGAGGAFGSLLGSRIALGANEDTLAFAFGVLILLVSLRTLYRVMRPSQSAPTTSV